MQPAQASAAAANTAPPRKKKPLKDDTSSDDDSALSSGKLGSDPEVEPSADQSEDEAEEGGNADDDSHMDECAICEDGGELICCDGEGCDKAYHAECVNVDIDTLPLTWLCPSCIKPETKNTPNTKNSSSASSEKKKPVELDDDNGSEDSIEVVETSWGKGDFSKEDDKGGKEQRAEVVDDKSMDQSSDDDSIEVVEVAASSTKKKKGSASMAPDSPSKQSDKEKANTIMDTDNQEASVTSCGSDDDVLQKQPETETQAQKNSNLTTTGDTASRDNQPGITHKRRAVRECTIKDCQNHGKTCMEHGKLAKTCHAPDCENYPQGGQDVCVKHGAKLNRCNEKGCESQIARGGKCNKHWRESLRTSSSSLEGLEEGGTASSKKLHEEVEAKEGDEATRTTTPTFRTVTVPEGVIMGEMFHVLLGKGKVMGVVCPEGVHPGDRMIILEPNQDPPIPPQTIAKMNAQRLLNGIAESPSIVANAYWSVLWPALHAQGWVYTRQMNYNFGATTFFTPGSTALKKIERVLNVNYFETIKSVITAIAGNNNLAKDKTILEEFRTEVEKQKEAMKEKKNKQKKEKKRVEVLEKVADIDAWKYRGEREHIQVGSQYQIRISQLPKAGSYKSGEEKDYIEEQITDPAALKASLTPAAWYELAKEPNLADKFHKAIMECKKQMPAVASALDKPFRFCLWYYYHKYKIPSNSENYQSLKKLVDGLKVHLNSDDCAICDEGGDLVCCETCTDSYHLTCLGLQSTDVEGEWSCPACTRKRKLQLSPTKSPNKKRLSSDSNYSHTQGEKQS